MKFQMYIKCLRLERMLWLEYFHVGNGFQARFIQNNREAASCSKSEAQREVTESLSQDKVKRWHGRVPF